MTKRKAPVELDWEDYYAERAKQFRGYYSPLEIFHIGFSIPIDENGVFQCPKNLLRKTTTT